MDSKENNFSRDPEERNEADIQNQLTELIENGISTRLIERLTKLVHKDLAQQVYVEEEKYSGIDPETARRTGVEAGEKVKEYRPTNIFILPLNEQNTSHLIIDFRGNRLKVYKTNPVKNPTIDTLENRYEDFFINLTGPIYIPRKWEDKSLSAIIRSNKLHRDMLPLQAGRLQIDSYGPGDEEECIRMFEQAIKTAQEINRKREEFQKKLVKAFLEKTDDLFSPNEE